MGMMMTAEDRLCALLKYDPATGIIIWKEKPCSRIIRGSMAGTVRPDGYVQIRLNNHFYFAHRIAYLMMTGSWPDGEIDHKDCDPTNNRWSNLRLATRAQNAANLRRSRTNTSGYKGVYYHTGDRKWMARIRRNGKTSYIGSFATPEEAHAAYIKTASCEHGEFARAA